MTREEQIEKAAVENGCGFYDNGYARFAEGAAWADSHPHWVSVEDELPPLHEHMLIAPTQEHIERVGGRAVDVICFMDEEHLAAWLPHITHWMSFPAPPVSKIETTDEKGGEE